MSRPQANPESTRLPLCGRTDGEALPAGTPKGTDPAGARGRPVAPDGPLQPGATEGAKQCQPRFAAPPPPGSTRSSSAPGPVPAYPSAGTAGGAPVPHALQLGGRGGREAGQARGQLGRRPACTPLARAEAGRARGSQARWRKGAEGRGSAGGPEAPPRALGAALPGCRRRHFPRAAARASPARREEPSRRSLRLGPPPPAGPAPTAAEALCTRPGTVPGAASSASRPPATKPATRWLCGTRRRRSGSPARRETGIVARRGSRVPASSSGPSLCPPPAAIRGRAGARTFERAVSVAAFGVAWIGCLGGLHQPLQALARGLRSPLSWSVAEPRLTRSARGARFLKQGKVAGSTQRPKLGGWGRERVSSSRVPRLLATGPRSSPRAKPPAQWAGGGVLPGALPAQVLRSCPDCATLFVQKERGSSGPPCPGDGITSCGLRQAALKAASHPLPPQGGRPNESSLRPF